MARVDIVGLEIRRILVDGIIRQMHKHLILQTIESHRSSMKDAYYVLLCGLLIRCGRKPRKTVAKDANLERVM